MRYAEDCGPIISMMRVPFHMTCMSWLIAPASAGCGPNLAVGRIRGSEAKAHPHYYCDLTGLAALLAGFGLRSLTQEEQLRPDSWHWHILAERR